MNWPSAKGKKVLKALQRIGWVVKARHGGSHRTLCREGWPNYTWAFGDDEELGPRMLTRIAKHTGLKPEDI